MPASDRHSATASSLGGPADSIFAITPHASDELPEVTRALYVGTGGDVAVVDRFGGAALFRNVPGGTVLPVRVRAVRAPATTAGDLLGLV